METVHPLYQLRQHIRHTGRQFRYDTDNSWSLFHPQQGFVSAYDIAQVEEALDHFEQSLPTPGELLELASQILVNEESSPEARTLANLVLEFVQPLSRPALHQQAGSVVIIDWESDQAYG